jgi:hypothetical protein
VEPWQVRGEPARDRPNGRAQRRIGVVQRLAEALRGEGEEGVEVAIRDEGLDLGGIAGAAANLAHAAGPDFFPLSLDAPSSFATLLSARWMSTLTDPSDLPSTPAISAVLSSSTNRSTMA